MQKNKTASQIKTDERFLDIQDFFPKKFIKLVLNITALVYKSILEVPVLM